MVDLTPYLVAQWKCNETSGLTVYDSSGNGDHGTAQRDCSLLTVPGKVGGALSFNGTSDYIDTNNTFQTVFQSDFSINLWIKPNNAGFTFIFGCSDEFSTSSVDLYLLGTNKLSLNYTTNLVLASATSAAAITDNLWSMITAVVYHDTPTTVKVKVYINGSLSKAGTSRTMLMANYSLAYNLFVGSYNLIDVPTTFFIGSLDNVMIFNKALTQEDIDFLWKGGMGTEELTNATVNCSEMWLY